MANPTPQIPHLSNFRRGGARGRLRGRGGSHAVTDGLDEQPSEEDLKRSKDVIVQGTDNDASLSRLSAVEAGYLADPYARMLSRSEVPRKQPIINRGTYARTSAIDRVVDHFLSSSPPHAPKQIISLGAGSDTRFFRLVGGHGRLIYHELDFPSNTRAKISCITTNSALQSSIPNLSVSDAIITPDGASFHFPSYHIWPIDLRHLAKAAQGDFPSISIDIPTLIISECCLCYLSPEDASEALGFFTRNFFQPDTPLALVIYEPIRPFDSFGRTMVSNLAARGIVLQTLQRYSSLAKQKARLEAHGFEAGQGAADIDFIWDHWISVSEKERLSRIEMLDEVEEWKMLARHYCVAWGWRAGSEISPSEPGSFHWRDWSQIEGQDGDDGGDIFGHEGFGV